VPGFVIKDENGQNLVTKGFAPPSRGSSINTLIGFAARPGRTAIGSSAVGAMSVFTNRLTARLSTQDAPFGTVFRDISTDVLIDTGDEQDPGLLDWSRTELYLRPGESVLAGERAIWEAALASKRRENVERFTYRFSVSRFAAAARKWLTDNPADSPVESFTFVSPVAVERAWRENNNDRVAMQRLALPLAFERVTNVANQREVAALSDANLGLVRSGTRRTRGVSPTRGTVAPVALNSLVAYGSAVTVSPVTAFAQPNARSRVASRVPSGTVLEITGAKRDGDRIWLRAVDPRTESTLYLREEAITVTPPVELGQSLSEVILAPVGNGASADIVDTQSLIVALNDLKASHRTISWISLSAAKGQDEEADDIASNRVMYTRFQLTLNGVDGRRITSVLGVDDIPEGQVRARVFGV
jgi:hypothetical protein